MDNSAMKQELQVQVDVCADLQVATMDVNRGVSSLESTVEVARNATRETRGATPLEAGGGALQDAAGVSEAPGSSTCDRKDDEEEALILSNNGEVTHVVETTKVPGSPKWSTVAKRRKRQPKKAAGARHIASGVRKPGKSL